MALDVKDFTLETAKTFKTSLDGTEHRAHVVLDASIATIGKLGANSGVDIGDVDVTSIIPGSGATNLGKNFDSVAGASDTGVAVAAIRDDALSALTPVDGDYVPLRVTNLGALWTNFANDYTREVGRVKIVNDAGTVVEPISSVAIDPQTYETVAASQTAQVLGATGAAGDYLAHIIIQPTATTFGAVTILDNGVEVYSHPGGTVDASLPPMSIPINAATVNGAWQITTGVGVKVSAFGTFT